MTTRRISNLTSKQHKHIKRDCDRMFDVLSLNARDYAQNWTDPQNGQTYTEYRLNKNLVLTLISRYSIVLRNKIVNKLIELENGNQKLIEQHNQLNQSRVTVEKVLSKAGRVLTVLGKQTKPMIKSKIQDIEDIIQPDLFKDDEA